MRWLDLVPAGGVVLDVAAGASRHTRLAVTRGHRVVAVDRDTSPLRDLDAEPLVEVVEADLEARPWPFPGRRFDGIVVTNYLHRPLLAILVGSLAPGGALVYETFAVGQERYGRPANPDWLLTPGELLAAVAGTCTVVAYEDVTLPRPARVQRIAAVRSATAAA